MSIVFEVLISILYVLEFSPFYSKISSRQEYSVILFYIILFICFWLEKKSPKWKFKEKGHKLPQLVAIWRGSSDFIFSYFECRQVWLNIFIDYCHLSNITKLKKKKKTLTVASQHKIILTIFGKKDFYLEIRKIISKMLQNFTKLSKQH